MKHIFSILFTCCVAFAYGNERPVFDEADDTECRIFAPIPFAAEEPTFEEDNDEEVINHDEEEGPVFFDEDNDDEAIDEDEAGQEEDETPVDSDEEIDENDADEEIDDQENEVDEEEEIEIEEEEPIYTDDEEEEGGFSTDEEENGDASEPMLGLPLNRYAFADSKDELGKRYGSYSSWSRYKTNFGMEKIFIRFPQKPALSQSSTLFTSYAYDHAVMYSFAGYFPPVGNIDPIVWFDEILYNTTSYPYNLVSHTIFQISNGDWIMDYVAYDYVQNLCIKARAIVTPFNGYILQCVKPNGTRDYFDYFLDHFWIKCDCHH